ncbi:unnamed protein product, partial [Rotaria sp. Silwood1]
MASSQEENVINQEDEVENYMKALDDSDIDDIVEELKQMNHSESEEY